MRGKFYTTGAKIITVAISFSLMFTGTVWPDSTLVGQNGSSLQIRLLGWIAEDRTLVELAVKQYVESVDFASEGTEEIKICPTIKNKKVHLKINSEKISENLLTVESIVDKRKYNAVVNLSDGTVAVEEFEYLGKQEDGYIQQGNRSKEEFESRIEETRKNNVTRKYKKKIKDLIKRVLDDEDIRLSIKKRRELAAFLKQFGKAGYKIFGFDAIVNGENDFFLGWNNSGNSELFISTNVIEGLQSRGPPELVDEYLLHEALCPVLGHYPTIVSQQELFPSHYPDKKRLETQTSKSLYKGWLREALRKQINRKAYSKEVDKDYTKDVLDSILGPLEEPRSSAKSPEWAAGMNVYTVFSDYHHDPSLEKHYATFSDLKWVFEQKTKLGFNTFLIKPFSYPDNGQPYAPFSAFAIDPQRIDWARVLHQGLTPWEKFENFEKDEKNSSDEYKHFYDNSPYKKYIGDYAFYKTLLTLRERHPGISDNDLGANEGYKFKEHTEYFIYEQFIAWKQLSEAIRYAQGLKAKVLFDLPFYVSDGGVMAHFNRQYLKQHPDGTIVNPGHAPSGQVWGGLADWNFDELAKVGFKPIADQFRYYADYFNYDGCRWDAAHFGVQGMWDAVGKTLAESKKGKDFLVIAEQLGNEFDWPRIHGMKGNGFVLYHSSEFWRTSMSTIEATYANHNRDIYYNVNSTHDSPRFFEMYRHLTGEGLSEKKKAEALVTEFALISSNWSIMCGDEYNVRDWMKRIVDGGAKWLAENPEEDKMKKADTSRHIQILNSIRAKSKALRKMGNLVILDNDRKGEGVSSFARVAREKSVVVVNNLTDKTQKVTVRLPMQLLGIRMERPFKLTNMISGRNLIVRPGENLNIEEGTLTLKIPAGKAFVFETAEDGYRPGSSFVNDWIKTNIAPSDWPEKAKNMLADKELLAEKDGLRRLIAVVRKYKLDQILKQGVTNLADGLSKRDIDRYSETWTFAHKNKRQPVSAGKWLVVETQKPNYVQMGKTRHGGKNQRSVSLDGGKTFFAVIPSLEPDKEYWMTFRWAWSNRWENKDYYFKVLPAYEDLKEGVRQDNKETFPDISFQKKEIEEGSDTEEKGLLKSATTEVVEKVFSVCTSEKGLSDKKEMFIALEPDEWNLLTKAILSTRDEGAVLKEVVKETLLEVMEEERMKSAFDLTRKLLGGREIPLDKVILIAPEIIKEISNNIQVIAWNEDINLVPEDPSVPAVFKYNKQFAIKTDFASNACIHNVKRDSSTYTNSPTRNGEGARIMILPPEMTEDGVKFTIYAPDAQSVSLAGDFYKATKVKPVEWSWDAKQFPMKKAESTALYKVWEIELPLESSLEPYNYAFVVNDGEIEDWIKTDSNENFLLEVSKISEPEKADIPEWIKPGMRVYELFPRVFNNFGPKESMSEEIDKFADYLAAQKFDIVWLMPSHLIGEESRKGDPGSPYSIQNQFRIQGEETAPGGYFGEEGLAYLSEALEKRNIKLAFDVVANHTASDHFLMDIMPQMWIRKNGETVSPEDVFTDVRQLKHLDEDVRDFLLVYMTHLIARYGARGFRGDLSEFVPINTWKWLFPLLDRFDRWDNPDREEGYGLLKIQEGGCLPRGEKYDDPNYYGDGLFNCGYGGMLREALDLVAKGDNNAGHIREVINKLEKDHVEYGVLHLAPTDDHDQNYYNNPPAKRYVAHFGEKERSVLKSMVFIREDQNPDIFLPLEFNGDEAAYPYKVDHHNLHAMDMDQGNWDFSMWYEKLIRYEKDTIDFRRQAVYTFLHDFSDVSNNEWLYAAKRELGGRVVYSLASLGADDRKVPVKELIGRDLESYEFLRDNITGKIFCEEDDKENITITAEFPLALEIASGKQKGVEDIVIQKPQARRIRPKEELVDESLWQNNAPGEFDTITLTNGTGAMFRGPVADPWRKPVVSKYDGFQPNPANYPTDRTVYVKYFEEYAIVGGHGYALNVDTLESFERYPFPKWVYKIDHEGEEVKIEKTMFMVQGEDTLVSQYKVLSGNISVQLEVSPALEQRGFHSQTKANEDMERWYNEKTGETDNDGYQGIWFKPEDWEGFPALEIIANKGFFERRSSWAYNIYHPLESTRGQPDHGDAFKPGRFVVDLSKGEKVDLFTTCAKNKYDSNYFGSESAETLRQQELERMKLVMADLPEDAHKDSFAKSLALALDQFIVRRDEHKTVMAGYPWFTDWGRDTLIVLRGILSAGRFNDAKDILMQFAMFEEDGTLPNIIHGEHAGNRDTVDAQVWFMVALEEYIQKSGDTKILKEKVRAGGRSMREVIENITFHYMDKGTPNGIHMDKETGLIWAPSHFTWMDTNYPAATPRWGYPIEIQALWYKSLLFMAEVSEDGGKYRDLADKVKVSINELYWNEDGGYLYDNIESDAGVGAKHGRQDGAFRSNQVFAVLFDIIEGEKAIKVVEAVKDKLVVPGMLRSLSEDSNTNSQYPYKGVYAGDEDTSRKHAYHNGTAWSWTYPGWIEAYAKAYGYAPEKVKEAITYFGPVKEHLARSGVGNISEVADGNWPHTDRGCDMQAWGPSENLRVYLDLMYGDHEHVETVPAEEGKDDEAFTEFDLRDITDPEELLLGLLEDFVTLKFNKAITLIFEERVAMSQEGDPLERFRNAVDQLKKNKRYSKILEKVQTVVVPSAEDIVNNIDEYADSGNAAVFTFTLKDTREALNKIKSTGGVYSTYIEENGISSRAHYPLPEIVVISLTDAIVPIVSGEDVTLLISGDQNIILEEINILKISKEEEDLIVFLLPDAVEYDRTQLIEKLATLRRYAKSV